MSPEDVAGTLIVVGIYLALALLSWWGAAAWDSWFMLAFGWLWWAMAVLSVLWFTFVRPVDDDPCSSR